MINFIYVDHAHHISKIFHNDFNQTTDLWVTSSLKNKKNLERLLLNSNPIVVNDSIIRAQDFWLFLFSLLKNDDEITINQDLLAYFIEESFQQESEDKSLFKNFSANEIVTLLKILGPIALYDSDIKNMELFFEYYPRAAQEWQHVYVFIQSLARALYVQKKWVIKEWIPHLVLQRLSSKNISLPYRRIYIDLNFRIKLIEAQILKKLATKIPVTVLTPNINSSIFHRQNYFLKTYQELGASFKTQETKETNISLTTTDLTHASVLIFPNEIEQIKFFFEKSKELIRQNVKPNEIHWFFPNTQQLNPILLQMSEFYQQPIWIEPVSNIYCDPRIREWIDSLNLFTPEINPGSLEIAKKQNPKLLGPLKNIPPFLNHIKEIQDQDRRFFQKHWQESNVILDRDQFIKKIVQYWRWDGNEPIFLKILEALFLSTPSNVTLSFVQWIKFLKSLIMKSDLTTHSYPLADQILVFKIHEYPSIPAQYQFIGSITRDSLKSEDFFPIPIEHINILNDQFGYDIEHPLINWKETYLQWLIQQPTYEKWISSFHLDVQGNPASVHPSLLEGNNAAVTEMDATNHNIFHDNNFIKISEQQEVEYFKWEWPKQMSVTRLELFLRCPFRFFVEHNMKFSPPESRNFQLEYNLEGQLYHKLLEYILKHWSLLKTVKAELDIRSALQTWSKELLDNLSNNLPDYLIKRHRNQLPSFGFDFFKYHHNFLIQHPKVEVVLWEYPVTIFLDLKYQKFLATEPNHPLHFNISGKIDRIDIINDYFVIVDYKRTIKEEFDFSKWIPHQYYQMLLYGMAILHNPPPILREKKWGGAVFFNYSDLSFAKGFLINDLVPDYLEKPIPYHNSMDYLTCQEKLKEMTQLFFHQIDERISKFQAHPFIFHDRQELCENCYWSYLCPAPHLPI
ncbi:MAG: PD-(D/E)XK nuclease family protein [Bdellovibrionaceae bacterium]|nr:PD-(D/E)XK nuclease family protein [Pseudobdellovibrionaceae bacterium]